MQFPERSRRQLLPGLRCVVAVHIMASLPCGGYAQGGGSPAPVHWHAAGTSPSAHRSAAMQPGQAGPDADPRQPQPPVSNPTQPPGPQPLLTAQSMDRTPPASLGPPRVVTPPTDSSRTPDARTALPAPADMEIPLGEPFQLHANLPGFGPVKQAFVNRPGLIQILPPDRASPTVQLVGQHLGLVQVTLVNQADQVKTYTIRITPNVAYLKLLIRQRFPLARVTVSAAGDNALLVQGSVDAATDVDPIIDLLRSFLPAGGRVVNGILVTGPTQVQLEVCIARVDRTRLRQLGFNWIHTTRNSFVGNQVGNIIGVPSILAGGGGATGAAAVVNNFNAVGGATSDVLMAESTLFFGVTGNSSSFFGFLEALDRIGCAKIVARPTLITLSGRPADFLVGGELPYPSFELVGITGAATPAVDFKPFGTRLSFVPVVLGNGLIRLDVLPEIVQVTKETVVISGVEIPVFNTQRLRATVEMESGQSLALGGLLQTEEESDVSKVPVLGDLGGHALPRGGAQHRRIRTAGPGDAAPRGPPAAEPEAARHPGPGDAPADGLRTIPQGHAGSADAAVPARAPHRAAARTGLGTGAGDRRTAAGSSPALAVRCAAGGPGRPGGAADATAAPRRRRARVPPAGWHALSLRRAWGGKQALRKLRACHPRPPESR
jgi:Flp pilus assembly secretin CpaC